MDSAAVLQILSRDVELSLALPDLLTVVRAELPAIGMVVASVRVADRRPEIVAMSWTAGPVGNVPPRSSWTDAELGQLLEWHRNGTTRRGPSPTELGLAVLWPCAEPVDLMAAPLVDTGGDPAFLLVFGERGTLAEAHCAAVASLRQPLGWALGKDRRVHELEQQREALAADKRALLERLDRQEVVDAVVGSDAGLAPVMEKVRQVAATDVPVLLLGETGSGKEVVARAIHRQSRRSKGPMLRVNCGAIPAGLVDSDLFGHERGGFTGAVSARPGWFERADGGTLFLDEIGELPAEAQVRLLRVVQEGTLERVGGRRTEHVDVRVVAATNRDLHAMVRRGEFREDLWYRLSVFPIRIPSLGERLSDIPDLAAHFAARVGKRLGGAPLALSRGDIEILLAYHWPGNVRELAAVIERACILGDGRALRVAEALGGQPRGAAPIRTAPPQAAHPGSFLPLREVIRAHIESALVACHGRIEGAAGAARMLDLNPHTLRSKMRKLGIDWRRFRPDAPPTVLAP